MEPSSEKVTIFRSADASAAEDAAVVSELLEEAGLNPAVLDDSAPGVPPGTVEVQVPAGQEKAAEAALAAAESEPEEEADSSEEMDLVEVFQGVGATGELEAMSIRAVLDANEIPSVIVGTSQIPNLPFIVKTPRVHEERARRAIEEAQRAGAAAAEEAEQASEDS